MSAGAELFVRMLEEDGVEHVFGNPGTTELPIMNAIRGSDELTYILGLHEDVDTTIVVSNNSNYRILKHNTFKLLGGTEDEYDFEPMEFELAIDLVANARSHGADARRVDEPAAVAPAIEEALSSEGPSVLDITVRD